MGLAGRGREAGARGTLTGGALVLIASRNELAALQPGTQPALPSNCIVLPLSGTCTGIFAAPA